MTLDATQLLCLRAADEPVSDEVVEALRAAGEDPEAWAALPGLVREAVLLGALPVPELAGAVLAETDLDDMDLSRVLVAPRAPELAQDVMAALGLEEAHADLVGALLDDAGPEPELADGVLAALGLADVSVDVGGAVSGEAGQAPELAAGVLDSLGLEDDSEGLGAELRAEVEAARAQHGELAHEAVAASGLRDGTSRVQALLRDALDQADDVESDPEAIIEGVMARIGAEVAGAGDLVAEALSDEAGPAPALWDGVAGALGLDEVAASEDGAEVLPFAPKVAEAPAAEVAPAASGPVVDLAERRSRWERWSMVSAGLAAAAALLVIFTGTDPVAPNAGEVIELAAVNQVEFEDIQSDEAFVQVIDHGDDSPPIIFITEPVEEDLFDDVDGRL